MTPSEAMRVIENPKDYTVQERKDAKKVIASVGSLGQDKTAPLKRSKGGDTPGKKKGKVPVIAISVGMAEMKEDKKKYAKGGYANCGASMSATQDSSRKMMGGGYATKKK